MKTHTQKAAALAIATGVAVLCAACAGPATSANDAEERAPTYEVTGSLINRPHIAHVSASTSSDDNASAQSQNGATSVSQMLGGGSPAQGALRK
jgi:hypothetical protein